MFKRNEVTYFNFVAAAMIAKTSRVDLTVYFNGYQMHILLISREAYLEECYDKYG